MKTKLVVINEHTLGYILPQMPNYYCVLHSSILKGGSGSDESMPISALDKVRLAGAKDFEDFRVCFNGFSNPEEYEFSNL